MPLHPTALPTHAGLNPKWARLEWRAHGYRYWKNKREFMRESDIYPTWCLFAVESGTFAYSIGQHSGSAASGSLVLCPPMQVFGRSMSSPELTFHFVLLSFEQRPPESDGNEGYASSLLSGIPPALVSSLAKPFTPLAAAAPVEPEESKRAAVAERAPSEAAAALEDELPLVLTPANRQRLFDTFDKWRQCGGLPPAEQLAFVSHYWRDIWTTWCLERIGAEQAGNHYAVQRDEQMRRAALRLEEQCGEPYSVKELADELGLSPVQLIRRFRAAYRITPGDYLTGLRLERACQLLRETRMTVEQIALACGYASGYYLSRLFAARIGMPPSEYRKKYQV